MQSQVRVFQGRRRCVRKRQVIKRLARALERQAQSRGRERH